MSALSDRIFNPTLDDLENQRAMRLALEADEDKARTIGK